MEIKGNINAGYGNIISGTTIKSSILGGENNNMSTSPGQPQVIHSSIVGGVNNGVYRELSVILNGYNNNVAAPLAAIVNERKNTILNGNNNLIANGADDLIGGGNFNTIDGTYYSRFGTSPNRKNTILNGYNSSINASIYNFIGGGLGNVIEYYSSYDNIVGGYQNRIFGSFTSIIGGGAENFIGYGGNNVIGGGRNNILTGSTIATVIVGGQYNYITDSDTSSIVGGSNNRLLGVANTNRRTFIGGGINNTITASTTSIIGGGEGNTIDGDNFGRNSILGGQSNNISRTAWSIVGGGYNNTINKQNVPEIASSFNFIGGGTSNNIYDSDRTIIVGGYSNNINASTSSIIVGGEYNVISGNTDMSFIGGGENNTIDGNYSSILGGQNNIVNNHTNAHIIGSNITSISANTTHVERLNIGTIDNNESLNDILVRDTNGTIRYRSSRSIADSFTGNTSGDCITDLYVTNINSCSPLNINPLDEGNVYFGSTSGVTIDVINNRVGIKNNNPTSDFTIGSQNDVKIEIQSSAPEGNVKIASSTSSSQLVLKNGSASNRQTDLNQFSTFSALGGNVGASSGDFFITNGAEEGAMTFRVGSGASLSDVVYLFGNNSTSKIGPFSAVPGSKIAYLRHLSVEENASFGAVGSTAFAQDIRIDANGVLTTNTSDERLKENVASLSGSLETILQLSGVSYNWIDRDSGGDDTRYGFIAQRVDEVDSNLTITNSVDGYMGLKSDCFTPLIVESIKELHNNPSIPNYTPSSSGDTYGNVGNITIDDDYIYVKTNNGWKRTTLQSF